VRAYRRKCVEVGRPCCAAGRRRARARPPRRAVRLLVREHRDAGVGCQPLSDMDAPLAVGQTDGAERQRDPGRQRSLSVPPSWSSGARPVRARQPGPPHPQGAILAGQADPDRAPTAPSRAGPVGRALTPEGVRRGFQKPVCLAEGRNGSHELGAGAVVGHEVAAHVRAALTAHAASRPSAPPGRCQRGAS